MRTMLAVVVCLLSVPTWTLAQTLATYQISAGAATFGLALPRGAAAAGVKVGALPTQTDVKTRWSDGSIRFAIVSTQVGAAGSFPITAAAPTIGTLAPSWPSVAVSFTVGGQAYVASLPPFDGADAWLSGPIAREARVMVTPRSGGVAEHQLLQVIYDIRSYAAGGHRVDITVQNVRDVTAGASVVYNVAITIGGQTVFSRSGVTHSYLTRWRKVFTTGGLTEADVTPDLEPFYQSKAIPRFHAQVIDQTYTLPADAPCQPEPAKCYDILRFGDMSAYMGAPGGRTELAPYPDWVARWLVHKRASARAYMLTHANLSGSWSGHITKADGRSPIRLDEMPNYWLDGRSGTGTNGPQQWPRTGCCPSLGGLTESLEAAHLPSLTFVPYLVTGDRYYLDQQKFWSQHALLTVWPGDGWRSRNGALGILYQHQPRGFGWGLRVIGEMTAYLPDSDPDKSYYTARVDENLAFLDRRALIEDPGGPLGVPFTERMGPDENGLAFTSMWQVSYITYAVDRLHQLGWNAGAAFLRHAATFQVRLFTSGPAYPPIYGAPYYPRVGRWTNGFVATWFSMSELFAVNYRSGQDPPQPFTGYYGPETRILLQIAVAHRIPRAQEALDYLSTQPGVMSDIYARSGWAIASVGPGVPAPATHLTIR